jgi:ferredoxin
MRFSRTLTASVGEQQPAIERMSDVKVVVDWDLCESNALCMAAAPEVFELQEDDTLLVLQENPDESLRDKVEAAVRACPKQAITLQD